MSSGLFPFLQSIPWFGWVAIVAIVSGSVAQIVRSKHMHDERMEMIRQGINPDGHKSAGTREV